jgi:hypothetical protein
MNTSARLSTMKSNGLLLIVSVSIILSCSGCDYPNKSSEKGRGFETMTVFKPDTSKGELQQNADHGVCGGFNSEEFEHHARREEINKAMENMNKREQEKREKEYKSAPASVLRLPPTTTNEPTAADIKEFRKKDYLKKVDSFVFDLNTLSMQGWEIKSSRRAWVDINDDEIAGACEWGTEYILQRKLQ